MLGYKGRKVVEDEWFELGVVDAFLEDMEDVDKDTVDVGQKLLVVARQLCPPRVDEGPEGHCDEVIELGGELGVSIS